MEGDRVSAPVRCPVNLVNFGSVCDRPATITVEYGCVHEHLRTDTLCASHAPRFLASDGNLVCNQCWPGHRCPIIGRVKVAP